MTDRLRDSFRKVGALLRRSSRGEHGGNHPDTQNRVLTILKMNPGVSQKTLSYILGIRPQSAGEIIRKMEGNGLIVRQSDANDSRINKIYLTKSGQKKADELSESLQQQKSIFDCLSQQETTELEIILQKIIDNNPVDESEPDFSPFRRPRMEARRMPFQEEVDEEDDEGSMLRRHKRRVF